MTPPDRKLDHALGHELDQALGHEPERRRNQPAETLAETDDGTAARGREDTAAAGVFDGSVRALGLDLGAKRIGVAGCDHTGLIATGLTTIENRSHDWVVAELRSLIQSRDIDLLVVGLPYTLDGEVGKQAKRVQKMARRLSKAVALPVVYVDERLTSFAAKELLAAEGRSPRRKNAKQKGMIDRKAAAIILQQWLNARRQS